MATITGTSGPDTLNGTAGDDIFNTYQGGDDTLDGGGGNDLFRMGSMFNALDSVSGGTGIDTLSLAGDYSAGLFISSTMINSIERIILAPEQSYNIAFYDGAIASGKSMVIDASKLGVADVAQVDLSYMTAASSDIKTVVLGGAVHTVVSDSYGATILKGGAGQDALYVSTMFTSADSFDGGGAGGDYVHFNGDFSGGLTITGAMMKNFLTFYLDAGNSYKLTLEDGVVGAGQQMTVFGGGVGPANTINFNGSQETDGSFYIYDGQGNDILRGGANGDYLQGGNGGNDTLFGMGGDDTLQMFSKLTKLDRIDGGAGVDELGLSGDYSAGLVTADTTLKNIENVYLSPVGKFRLTFADGNVAAGQTLNINGGNLNSNDWLKFDGSKETDGNYYLTGGAGKDTLKGGAGSDTIQGGLNADVLTGNGGSDTFLYQAIVESKGASYDRVTDFDTASDQFHFTGGAIAAPTAIDAAVNAGQLDAASIFSGLAAAIGAAQLHVGHAVVFTADSGDLAGHSYLLVDENGIAGYQSNGDMLIEITGGTNLPAFSIDNII